MLRIFHDFLRTSVGLEFFNSTKNIQIEEDSLILLFRRFVSSVFNYLIKLFVINLYFAKRIGSFVLFQSTIFTNSKYGKL